MPRKKDMGGAIIVLFVLLALRTLGQLFLLLLASNPVTAVISLILGVVYLASITGIAKRMKWGFAAAITIAAFDAAIAFVTGGVFSAGALIVDILIIVLAASEIKKMNGKVTKRRKKKK